MGLPPIANALDGRKFSAIDSSLRNGPDRPFNVLQTNQSEMLKPLQMLYLSAEQERIEPDSCNPGDRNADDPRLTTPNLALEAATSSAHRLHLCRQLLELGKEVLQLTCVET